MIALEVERRTIDAKIAGVGSEARGAAAAASTVAASAAVHALLERIIKLEIEVATLRAQRSDAAPKLEPPSG